jgi:hypothetical protein
MKKIAGARSKATLSAILYGQSKMMKTTTALLAPPEMRPMAVLDCDGGANLRLRVLSMTAEERAAAGMSHSFIYDHGGPWVADGVDFFYPEPQRYFQDCFDFATREAGNYKLVVIDTISHMAENFLDEIKVAGHAANMGEKRFEASISGHTTISPNRSDYGMAQDRVLEILDVIDVNQPCHMLLLAHEKTGEIRDAEAVKRVVAGPRTVGNALNERIPSRVDVVLKLETRAFQNEDGKRDNKVVVRSRPHNIYIAGDRSGLFDDGDDLDPGALWVKIGNLIKMTPPTKDEVPAVVEAPPAAVSVPVTNTIKRS